MTVTNPPAPMIAELPAEQAPLAKVEQRADLAEKLVDVMGMSGEVVNDNQKAFTGNMIEALIPHLSPCCRIEIASRLTQRLAAAPGLLRFLFLQPIEVARPIIEGVTDMPDGLLIEGMAVSPEHQRAIAGRFRLSERVIDALFEAGSPALQLAMLARDEVRLAPDRIEKLVTLSKTQPAIRMPLLNRLELQPHQGFTMFWWMDEAQRKRVFSRFSMGREPLQDRLSSLFVEVFTDKDPDPVVKGILSLCDRRHRPRSSTGQVVAMPAVEQILRAVRRNPTPEICATVGLLAGINKRTSRRVMDDVGGEPFAVLCKSLGVSRSHFSQILTDAFAKRNAKCRGPEFAEARQAALLNTFDVIARDYARTILRYWDWQEAMKSLRENDSASAGHDRP